MFKNQRTSQPEASPYVNGDRHDMAWEWEKELVELDDVQLATVVGGLGLEVGSSTDLLVDFSLLGNGGGTGGTGGFSYDETIAPQIAPHLNSL